MCKNHKHSYTPITDLEPNQGQTAIRICYKKNKIPWNTTHKERKGPLQGELQTNDQEYKRGPKHMEKHSMLVVRKNQYQKNGQIDKAIHSLNAIPLKLPMTFFK